MGILARRAVLALLLMAGAASAQDAKQILPLTKSNWILVREFDGQDLLYFTNILAWRCGVERVRFAINGAGLERLEMEPCYEDEVTPNAIKAEDILPYLAYGLGTVEQVQVEVTFPDGSAEVMDYARADVVGR